MGPNSKRKEILCQSTIGPCLGNGYKHKTIKITIYNAVHLYMWLGDHVIHQLIGSDQSYIC